MRYLFLFLVSFFLSAPSWSQEPPITLNGVTYNWCGDEGQNCTLSGSNDIVFGNFDGGVDNGHIIASAWSGNADCFVDGQPFGSDPAPGFGKHCWTHSHGGTNPPTVSVTANPATINSGQSSTLSWTSTNATSCSGIGSGTGTSGSQSESPTSTTTYTETCTGAGGSGSGSATVTVNPVNPPPTVTLTANPSTITAGGSSTLTLSTSNATSCSGPITGTSGSTSVSPSATTTYTETCTGPGGTASGSATVTVNSGGTCQASNTAPAPAGSNLIEADFTSSDTLRVYPNGATVNMLITTRATAADTLNWSIVDSLGNGVKSGSFSVAAGNITTTVPCSLGSLGGYFNLTASLTHGGGSLPSVGSRPAGGASFGLLPSTGLPAPVYASPDQHRIGMQGFNDNTAALADLGVFWTIDDHEQSQWEPNAPNTYNPTVNDHDPYYTTHNNIHRLIRLDGIPPWNSSNGMFNDSYSLPVNQTEFGGYMAKVGTSENLIHNSLYPNDRRNYYQVTWEPSLGWPQTDGTGFHQYYNLVYPNLHSTDPHAFVMGPAEPFPNNNDHSSGGRITATAGLCALLDGVATHGYYDAPTTPNMPPERFNQISGAEQNSLNNAMSGLRATMQACKPNMVLWNTEVGISYDNGVSYTGASANQLWAQAVVAARTHIIILGEGAQVTFYFFGPDFPDNLAGYGSFFDLSDPQGAFGATNLSPKPEAMAFAALSRVLDGTTTLGKVNNLPATAYGYSFQQMGTGGKVITALWAHDNAHWPVNGQYSTTYCVPYVLSVGASGTSGTVTVLDVYGNATSVPYNNGQVMVNLTESPIYVVANTAPAVTAPVGYTGQ